MNIKQEDIEHYILGHKLESMTKKELIEIIVQQGNIISKLMGK